MKHAYLAFLTVSFMIVTMANSSDFSQITVLGLKLGMTMDEVKEKYPSIQTSIVKHWGTDDVLYYTATIPPEKINNWTVVSMLFSSFRQGKKLYKFQVEQFVGDNVFGELEKKVIDKFGVPDCSAGYLTGKELTWGVCSGNEKFQGENPKGQYLSFIYHDAQMIFVMEDRDLKAHMKKQVLQYDEKTRLKEVLELDF
ncbi:MAG: hypothetical protein KJ737_14000 [Proteobacteria bacterium]|nr:hypothetical protein [Pseudomonadota bacterium]